MSEADALTASGIAELNVGRFDAAAARFLAALGRDLGQEQAWLGLAAALALERKLGDLISLAEYRQRVRGDGFLYFHGATGMLVGYRLYDHVRALARLLPGSSPFHLPALYHAGCAALLAGDEDDAFAGFTRFKALAAGREGDLPIGADSPFNIAWRQAMLIEDHAYVEGLAEDASDGKPLPAIGFTEKRCGRAAVTLAAACDAAYFKLFAPGFVRSAAAFMPAMTIHLHVIAPDEAAVDLFAALAAEAPALALNLSTEPAGAWRSGAYYAANRFLRGPALLDRYGGKLVLTDIDIDFLASLDDLLSAASGYGFTGFRHDGAGPCSRWPAVLTIWDPDQGGAELLDRVGRFIRSKLDIQWPFNWMLDQAALGSVLRWARVLRPDLAIAIAIANEVTGRPWSSWVRSVGGDEKAELIRAAGLAARTGGLPVP